MQCLLCGHDYDKKSHNDCPICKFPTINFPAGVPIEEGIKSVKPVIDKHKEGFEKNVTISAVLYDWEFADGKLMKKNREKVAFGKLDSLVNNTVWLNRKFDRLSEREEVEVRLCVEVENSDGGRDFEILIMVPNLKENSEQELGISVTDKYAFSVAVRNAAGESGNSIQKNIFG